MYHSAVQCICLDSYLALEGNKKRSIVIHVFTLQIGVTTKQEIRTEEVMYEGLLWVYYKYQAESKTIPLFSHEMQTSLK